MAKVQSIGGIATLMNVETEGSAINVAVRLFAKVDLGTLAIDPGPSMTVGTDLGEIGRLQEHIELTLSFGALPAGHRAAHWSRVIEALQQQFGVRTDAETLMRLPFDLVPDGELRAAMEAGG